MTATVDALVAAVDVDALLGRITAEFASATPEMFAAIPCPVERARRITEYRAGPGKSTLPPPIAAVRVDALRQARRGGHAGPGRCPSCGLTPDAETGLSTEDLAAMIHVTVGRIRQLLNPAPKDVRVAGTPWPAARTRARRSR